MIPDSVFVRLLGTAAFVGISVCSAIIASSPAKWCAYGRETLYGFAAFLLALALIRFTYFPLGWISTSDARTMTAFTAICFFASTVQVVYVHWTWHKVERDVLEPRQQQ